MLTEIGMNFIFSNGPFLIHSFLSGLIAFGDITIAALRSGFKLFSHFYRIIIIMKSTYYR